MQSLQDRVDWAFREMVTIAEKVEQEKLTETAFLGLCIIFAANMIVDKMEEIARES